jgi:hypothetical protein
MNPLLRYWALMKNKLNHYSRPNYKNVVKYFEIHINKIIFVKNNKETWQI